MEIYVIVPGFGAPNLAEKTRILVANLATLNATKPLEAKIVMHVHAYDESAVPEHESITVHRGPGIVGQFLRPHLHTSPKPDYVMLLLDDVELMPNYRLDVAIDVTRTLGLDICSPCLTQDSPTYYAYMRTPMQSHNHEHEHVRLTSACELFCYLMPHHSFVKYMEHLREDANPYMWGMDLLLVKHFGLRVGMMSFACAKHWFMQASYGGSLGDTFKQFHDYLALYGETQASLATLPAVLKTVTI